MKKPSSSISEARAIVARMPYNEAQRLRWILTLPCTPERRAKLIARKCGSIGALEVAQLYNHALSGPRRAA